MSILTEFQGQRIAQDYFNASASQLTEKILAAKKTIRFAAINLGSSLSKR